MYISVSPAAQKLADALKKQTVPENQPAFFEARERDSSDSLTMEQVCDILSVSSATVKNWVRLGKLGAADDGKSFSRTYVENLLAQMKSGKDNRLKGRRNKNSLTGKGLYKDYIKNETNREVVEDILAACGHVTENEMRIILAYFAVQLYRQSGGLAASDDDWLYTKPSASGHSVFHALVSDLLGNIDFYSIDLSNIKHVFNYRVRFVPTEDTLGFIYISLRDLGQRKQTGAYYTPAKTVNMLISRLLDCTDLKHKTVCDFCCGTGNFLIGLLGNGVNAGRLYGQDIDEISIFITRINMFLLNNDLTKEQLDAQFVCGNTLETTFARTFSVILGNPPWGYNFSREETAYLLDNYRTAKSRGMESYDLFIEKGLDLLEKDGYLAFVLPEALLSVASHLQARRLIVEKASFKFVSYLGDAFSGVQCPAIILGVQKDGQGNTKQCRVLFRNAEFTIAEDRETDASLFSFNMSDNEYDCLKAVTSIENARYLADNAKFALGIVTGNNREYIRTTKEDGFEEILRGGDILRYSIKHTDSYIRFAPESFQQAAPIEMYRAQEKLLYRFISEVPVFAYDDRQTLTLNSCNILIPQIEGMGIKYVMAVLNSRVAAYFLIKKFNSVKLLRSHIESFPIPMVSTERQNEIVKKVDHIMSSKENISDLYEDIDHDIMDIFELAHEHRELIRAALTGKNLFIPK